MITKLAAVLISVLMLGLPQPEQKTDLVVGLERRVFERINEERVRENLHPLKLDRRLSDIARAHSQDMAANGYVAHVNKDGLDPTERGRAAGYTCSRIIGRIVYSGIAENIFQNNLYGRKTVRGVQIVYEWNNQEKIAASTVSGWIKSPGHRANIMSSLAASTGVGVGISSDFKVYITQEFC